MNFSEDFLHFIWQFRLFNTKELFCAGGEKLQVLQTGILNKNAGPDFSYARLKINNTLWVGNVEIHIKSSDWLLHGHQNNHSYESVVLHVVYQHDKSIYRKDGSVIPVLVLKGLFSESLEDNYTTMISSVNKFPCEKQIREVDEVVIQGALSRMIVERFEQKSAAVLKKVDYFKGNWDETFYYFMAMNFGFKVNALPFELLAAGLPQQILARNKDNKLQTEALIFGQAGFLTSEFIEEYPKTLKEMYIFLQKKYELKPIAVSLWKFLRMRPQNFPTVRLAQFSALVTSAGGLFSKILEFEDLQSLCKLFERLPVNNYWQNHYHFNSGTKNVNVQLGMQSIHNIIINTICVFLCAYGRYTDQVHLMDRAFEFLEKIPAERNSIITQYTDSGVRLNNALMSQALLQLNKCYCTQKKCLNCSIGIKILKK